VGEAARKRRRRDLEEQIGLRPLPGATTLTEQQRTAALLMYMFAILTWSPGPGDEDDDERWSTYCMARYCAQQDTFEGSVWWALRHENSPSLRRENWLSYLEHVLLNHRLLAWCA